MAKKTSVTGKKSKLMKKVMGKKSNIKVVKKKLLNKNIKDKSIKKKLAGKTNKKIKNKSVETTNCKNSTDDITKEVLEDIEEEHSLKDDTMDASSENEVQSPGSEEDEEDEGYVESVTKDIFSKEIETVPKSKQGKHRVFDEDESFDDLQYDISTDLPANTESLDEDDSDSDAPPDEGSISKGKDIFAEDNIKLKKEILNLKKQVKETRRLKHEKNREQQLKKRERLQSLEKSRLPEDLLDAVAREETATKNTVVAKPKQKIVFDDDMLDDQMFTDDINEGNLIALDQGIKVEAIQHGVKKHDSIAKIAADFRYKALYKKVSNRMTSVAQRQMLVKQQKSGKMRMS